MNESKQFCIHHTAMFDPKIQHSKFLLWIFFGNDKQTAELLQKIKCEIRKQLWFILSYNFYIYIERY
jgi:hypothetical protein